MSCSLTPTVLTDADKGRICGVLSVGCDRHTAVNYLGRTLADLRRAMQSDATFAADVCRTEAGVELFHMKNVYQAAQDPKNWRTSVWWLEQRSPERFGARSAGAITARRLKSFLEIIAERLLSNLPDGDERRQLLTDLRELSASVDQMLRDSQADLGDLAVAGRSQLKAAIDAPGGSVSLREGNADEIAAN